VSITKTIDEIIKVLNKDVGSMIPHPASDDDIDECQQDLVDLSLEPLPQGYIDFLKKCNGLAWNGIEFYSTDQIVEADNPSSFRLMDLVSMNDEFNDLYELDDKVLLGRADEDYYTYDIETQKYETLELETHDAWEEFDTFEELFLFTVGGRLTINNLQLTINNEERDVRDAGKDETDFLILGAITGDVIGSVYEFHNVKCTDFELFTPKTTFTDDSILTVATMEALLSGKTAASDYTRLYQSYGRKYPNRGWGNRFHYWIHAADPQPYDSWGNGSAMRASPIGWAFNTIEEVLAEAEKSASVSHNHPEGIKGAQAAALAVFLARNGVDKEEIQREIANRFGYNLDRTCDHIRADYGFDESCQGTVPEAVVAFLESESYEDAIRLAVSLGGDSDTLACITGGIAEAYYGGVPAELAQKVLALLPAELISVIEQFSIQYKIDIDDLPYEHEEGKYDGEI